MPKVRGSKQENLVIKPHRPGRRVVSFLTTIVFIGLLTLTAFAAGIFYQQRIQMVEPGEKEQFERLKQQFNTLQRDQIVDKLAVDSSRQTINALEADVHKLKREVAFYKSVMKPESLKGGLQVQRLEIEPLQRPRTYQLEWVLTQVGKNDAYTEGIVDLQITVKATDGGVDADVVADDGAEDEISESDNGETVLSLSDLVIGTPDMAFKFRYFTTFQVEVQLPAGYEPLSVEILADTEGKKPQSISRKFDWMIQEAIADVGQR